MKFSEYVLDIMKRLAKMDGALVSSRINENGVFTVQLVAVYDMEVAVVSEVSEDATEAQRGTFERRVDLLENAIRSQEADEAAREAKIRGILAKLTKEERMLIERPLPEEIIRDIESADEGEY